MRPSLMTTTRLPGNGMGINAYISAMDAGNYWQRRMRSFGYAFKGIAVLFRSQAHAKIHFVATILVIALSLWLGLAATEWALMAMAITLVWVAEGINTAIEFAVDLASPEHHVLAGKAKDVAAGAVLLASIGAVAVGAFLLLPKIWHMF